MFFFFNDTATTEIYTLSLHDALPIYLNIAGPEERAGEVECVQQALRRLTPQCRTCLLLQLAAGFSQREIAASCKDRKSTRLNSSHTVISYAVFCLKKKKKHRTELQAV